MKKGISQLVFSGIIALLLFTGCNKEGAGCFDKAGAQKTIFVDVPAFTTIDVTSNVDVLLLADGDDNVELTTGENLLSGISFEVEAGTLKIDNHNSCFWSIGYEHPLVTIRNSGLEKITQHGYGKIYSKDTLVVDNISLLVEDASGSIDIKVKSDFVRVVSNNVGLVTLAGTTQQFHAGHYWNDGILDAKNLVTDYCYIDQNGTNRMEINVAGKLEGQITNLGNVYLYGQEPAEEVVEIAGVGRIINRF